MNHSILLVQPPMSHPGYSDPGGLCGLQVMKSIHPGTVFFDAGMDFYRNFLLDTNQLNRTLELLEERRMSGELEHADQLTRNPRRHIPSRDGGWRRLIDETPVMTARLQSGDCFEPTRAANDFLHLDRILALVSAAYYPSTFSRSGFHHPGLNHISDVIGFINNTQLNPFMQYGLAVDPQTSESSMPDMTVLLVTRAGQVAPAASLMKAWSRRWPQMALAAAGEPSLITSVHAAVGNSLPGDPEPEQIIFWEAFQKLWLKGDGATISINAGAQDHSPVPAGLPSKFGTYPLQDDAMASIIAAADRRVDKTIVWADPQGELKAITGHLYAAARQGGWNHLILPDQTDRPLVNGLIAFASANPTIVHSWCLRTQPASQFSDPLNRLPQGSAPYGDTAPLPGLPLWQILQDPVYLSAYQQRLGAKTLMQLRLDPVDSKVYEIGRQLDYHYVKPDDLPIGYLDEICRMVEAGGSVGTRWLRHNLERAFLIAYVEEHGVIVGNSSLKQPRREYIEAVSVQSGLDLRNYLERGYTSVRPEYRGFGIGTKLLQGLTERAVEYKIFSVIGEENIATQKMAIRNRTRRVASFMSQKAGKPVGVWIPEWMLPEGIVLPPQPDLAADRNKP